MHIFLDVIFTISFVVVTYGKLTCIGENGSPVDMFVIYKLPRIDWYKTPPLVNDGHGYTYLDSNDMTFYLSKNSINSTISAAGQTLDQVYSKYTVGKPYVKNDIRYVDGATDQAHIFYNDKNPQGKEFFDNGHTKGALAFDKESGFWLITSVPKYPPPASEGYSYPHSGCMYGQMFILCVTFNSSAFNDIGLQLRFNNPHIHDANLPKDWESDYPNIKLAINGDMIAHPPLSNVVSLASMTGVKYRHFAKTNSFGMDLYSEFVAPILKSDILTETWQHGSILGPSCEKSYKVNDILNINMSLSVESFTFKNYDDHSKFVISTSCDQPFVCIGDINRQPTQFKRGGGTLCVEDINLWNQFNAVVTNYTHCQNNQLNKIRGFIRKL